MSRIQNIVEQCLIKMSQQKWLMKFPGHLPEEMIDPSIETSNDWKGWKPIKSIINDDDLNQLEHKIGHQLPESYRAFLKYKHFIDLKIPDHSVEFPKHLPDKQVNFLLKLVFKHMVPELIIGKGYIYFADFQDYGLLCFNTNVKKENNEYPIVYIDHEDLECIHPYANSFLELLEGDEGRDDKFVEYLNSLNN